MTVTNVTLLSGYAPDGVEGISNGAGENGGGIANFGNLTMTDCDIISNQAGIGHIGVNHGDAGDGGDGGGIVNSGTLLMNNCEIPNNVSGVGGYGDYRYASQGGRGGGISNSGTLIVDQSSVNDNVSGIGGSIDICGSCDFDLAQGGHGGGIYIDNRSFAFFIDFGETPVFT